MNFFKESYRWIRDAVMPTIDKLKKQQADELKKAFEEITDPPIPTRFLRNQTPPDPEELAAGGAAPVVDAFDLSEAKDIWKKYTEKWADGVLAIEKWIEKKNAIEEMIADANVPRLAEGNPKHLVRLSKRLVNDSNINVAMSAMKIPGVLAKGLRGSFEGFARQFFPIIFQKFKEKKTQVITESHSVLDNLLMAVPLVGIMEAVIEALNDKTAPVKINTAQFIERSLVKVPED